MAFDPWEAPVHQNLRPNLSLTRLSLIEGPIFDSVWIVFCPILCLIFAGVFSELGWADRSFNFGGQEMPLLVTMGATLSIGHLFLVFFRSHLNPDVTRLHPVRFWVVPLLLFGGLMASQTILTIGIVVKAMMDHWHSSMQSFGFGRIYDQKAGADPKVGRSLDMGLAFVIYVWPLLAGVGLISQLEVFEEFRTIGWHVFAMVPAQAEIFRGWIFYAVNVVGIGYLIFYVVSWARLFRQGHVYSPVKVALYVSLAITVVFAWGFNSFGHSFFIMESFHALQYFAIVWRTERRHLAHHSFGSRPIGPRGALVVITLCGLVSGFFTLAYLDVPAVFALMVTVALLHFWYDSFIWSVRANQVKLAP